MEKQSVISTKGYELLGGVVKMLPCGERTSNYDQTVTHPAS